MQVKTEYAELLKNALELHIATGGAPVEVSDGTRKVKIGPWLGKDTVGQLKELLLQWLASRPGQNKN